MTEWQIDRMKQWQDDKIAGWHNDRRTEKQTDMQTICGWNFPFWTFKLNMSDINIEFCMSKTFRVAPSGVIQHFLTWKIIRSKFLLHLHHFDVRKKLPSAKNTFRVQFFHKSTRWRWACSKMHRIKKQTPLWKTNFLRYTTLLLGPKRFVHS